MRSETAARLWTRMRRSSCLRPLGTSKTTPYRLRLRRTRRSPSTPNVAADNRIYRKWQDDWRRLKPATLSETIVAANERQSLRKWHPETRFGYNGEPNHKTLTEIGRA